MTKLINPQNKAIVVFGGSKSGDSPVYLEEARKLGKELRDNGVETLIYGGSSDGVMGAFASEFKNNGGKVIEITTESFLAVDRAYGHESGGIADHRIVTKTLPTRKDLMICGAKGLESAQISKETDPVALEAFKNIKVIGGVALPGGVGTYDEIFEVVAGNQEHNIFRSSQKQEKSPVSKVPFVLVNTNGIFDPIPMMIKHCSDHGFANEQKDMAHFKLVPQAKAAVDILINDANTKELEETRNKILGQDAPRHGIQTKVTEADFLVAKRNKYISGR